MTDNDPSDQQARSGLRGREPVLLRSMFEKAPVLIGITEGSNHHIKYLNATFCELLGISSLRADIPASEVLPEIKSGDEQEVKTTLQRLSHIYGTGEHLIVNEFKVKLDRDGSGVLKDGFFNFIYQPLKDEDGQVYGLFLAGYEVTDHMHAREEIVHGEHRLSLALNGARLGYWEVDAESNTLDVGLQAVQNVLWPAGN